MNADILPKRLPNKVKIIITKYDKEKITMIGINKTNGGRDIKTENGIIVATRRLSRHDWIFTETNVAIVLVPPLQQNRKNLARNSFQWSLLDGSSVESS